MDRIERTEATMQELFHQPAVTTEGTDPEFIRILQRFIFGDVCHTGSLDNRIRELLTVVLLAALGGAEVQVKSHVEGALKAGNSKEELVCALVHAGCYMGIPRLFNALNTCKELLTQE